MEWKKFKKERISLNYTVMLVPHSQKKMIHFKTPVWIFGVFFLGLLVLTGACLFFAGSRHQLEQVRREKAQLEQEWEQLARQKEQAEQENENPSGEGNSEGETEAQGNESGNEERGNLEDIVKSYKEQETRI